MDKEETKRVVTLTNFDSFEAIVLESPEKHSHTLVWLPNRVLKSG